MNTKIYEKTRWENIYRHKTNKNYVIRFNGKIGTSISKDERGNKIYDSETARKIRDNQIIIEKKHKEIKHKETFDDLWDKYIEACKYVKKQAYNTIIRKTKAYDRYIKGKINIPINKINKDYWAKFIDQLQCSNKQKNNLIKTIKAFLNWCIEENIVMYNEISKIKKYKETKIEMKYWTINEIMHFFTTIEQLINDSSDITFKRQALMIQTLVTIGFSLGDRIGETRALTYKSINKTQMTIDIKHSINYDTKSDSFLSDTKNSHSQREVSITQKVIDQISKYKDFLINEMKYPVEDNSLIFFNYETKKPYSDVTLRKQFHRFCDLCGVTKIRLYDLRHTYVATMMAEGKQLYQISSRIGHSNYSTTINKYGHLSYEIKKEIANTTDKYL
jgi:putative phage integrase|nr:MAG TPA: Integrase [Caudoviricetes sp.]